jgi:hypothetical protein
MSSAFGTLNSSAGQKKWWMRDGPEFTIASEEPARKTPGKQ